MRLQVTTLKNEPSRRAILAGITALGIAWVSGINPAQAQDATPKTMAVADAYDAAGKGDIILVDIRTPEEWAETGIGEGAIALDMRSDNFVPALVKLRQANPDTPIAMICRTGNRSGYATNALTAQGFPGLVDVHEGMAGGPNGPGWLKTGLPIYAGTPEEITKRLPPILGQ